MWVRLRLIMKIGIAAAVVLLALLIADADFTTIAASLVGVPPSSYKGKVVWITGAAGIDEALACEL